MRARLSTQTSQLGTISIAFFDEVTIGEDEECTLGLGSLGLSPFHARVYFDNLTQAFYVEDLNSLNGTKLNGKRVVGKERLESGQIVTLAEHIDFVFQILAPLPGVGDLVQERAWGTPAALPQPVSEEMGSEPPLSVPRVSSGIGMQIPKSLSLDGKPPAIHFLDVITHPYKKTYKLEQGATLVGRARECAIGIEDQRVSSRHALIVVEGERVTIQDLESKNHTFVNGEEIAEEVVLSNGDVIGFGKVEAKFMSSNTSSGTPS